MVTVIASIGGHIDVEGFSCPGSFTTLGLSGHTGSITRWESSLDNFATAGTSIANTTTTLLATHLTVPTYYRAVITNGACPSAYSQIYQVSSYHPYGDIYGSATVCAGTNSTTLTINDVAWHWESSTSSNFANDIVYIDGSVDRQSITVTNLTATTYYRAKMVYDDDCGMVCDVYSPIATITVSLASVGGTVAGSASVCTGTNSTALTLSGHTGAITRWESSTSSTFASAVTSIANTTTSLTATNLSATTYYRAVVTSGACAAAYSTTATVTVSPSLTASVCIVSNNAAFPNPLTFTATPANGGSAPVYQWYDGSTPVSTNSSTYTTPTLTMGQTLNIYVVMTSNATPCLNGSPATSNTLTINTPLPILPVTGLKLNGYTTATANLLNWYAYNEREMNDYTIERSLDGLYFNTIGNQPAIVSANGNNSYNYTDNNPLNGLNYYRIKGNSNNGQIQFSNIITIKFGSKQPTLLVAPNPVEYHLLNLKVAQLKKGVYTLKISDVLGRLISKRLLLYDGVSGTIKTSLPQTIKAGVYYVKLIGEGSEFTEKFIIQ